MTAFNISAAYAYFANHINRKERFDLLRSYSLPVAGSVHPIDWELFGAILTGARGTTGYGADLEAYEIKSAVEGNSFEYQYHLHGGVQKLEDEIRLDHIFISYVADYSGVWVRLIAGALLADRFESWRTGLVEAYSGPNRRLRYRRSVPYGIVRQEGALLMQIKDGVLVFP